MSSKKENQTTRQWQTVFNAAISTNTTTVGGIIDLQSVYTTALYGANGNTANAVSAKNFAIKAVDFMIIVRAYTDGSYVPVLEGVGANDLPVTPPNQYNNSITAAQAASLFSAVTNPYTNTIYAVNPQQIVAYDYPTGTLPASGSFVDLNLTQPTTQLATIGGAISRADAVTGIAASTGNLNFGFSYIPGAGIEGVDDNVFLRFSINSSGVTSGATFTVLASKTFEGMF